MKGTVSVCIMALLILQAAVATTFYPYSDPGNIGNWVLRDDMSDAFEGTQLDETKWLIQGRNGEYRSGFVGREPWQFSPENVGLENGRLKITTRHDPDYDWVAFTRPDLGDTNNCVYTTAGVSTKQTFTYGYMEIKCKAADAQTTSSFWTTGGGAELDVFESVGRHATRTDLMWSTIHDWQLSSSPNYVWTATTQLPFDFGDGFHIYGAEVTADFVKFYADGQLIHMTTREWVQANGVYSTRWPMVGGNHVWVDSEIFPWWGVPDPANLPADFDIEYVRVWKKGPAFLWDEYVAMHGLSGSKTANSDVDALSDWAEYVFNGNPTNPSDTGAVPTFDSEMDEYVFQVRNDVLLTAHVLAATNLLAPEWITNQTVNITVNDGSMATNRTMIDTSADQLFLRLLVEEIVPPPLYPSSKGNNVSDEWIAQVSIGSIHRSSGADGGYYDGTAMTTVQTRGNTVSVSLSPGYAGYNYTEVWRVWIDLNRDGDFTDPDEDVFAGGPSSTTVSGSFTLPSTYSYTGPTRMRVSMRFNNVPPSDTDFDWGEVEDFTFIIQ